MTEQATGFDVNGEPLPRSGTFGAGLRFTAPFPTRMKSARGLPKPEKTIERTCKACGASFIGLAPGRSGEAGLWTDDMRWFCSVECFPGTVPDQWITKKEEAVDA